MNMQFLGKLCEFIDKMPHQSTTSYTKIFLGYVQNGFFEKAQAQKNF